MELVSERLFGRKASLEGTASKRVTAVPRWAAAIFLSGCLLGCLKTPDRYAASSLDAKVNPPANFEVDGQPFCFVGGNNYYLSYKPKPMVDDVLTSAQAMGVRVMRIWGFIDRGSLDKSVPAVDTDDGVKDGFYFQYWDPQAKRPAYNDGANGLVGLDYALAKAAELNIKIVVVLTNNWKDFGGMDQYLAWYGHKAHHEFYTQPDVKQAYKDWAAHLITRTNTVTGKVYRDDPTIFAWELSNEARCKGSGAAGQGWTNSTIVDWAGEMSRYIKSIDPNHMVAVGDEGFLNGGGEHWTYKANDGVDHAALTALPGIDYGTFHMYPEDWGTGFKWADGWIKAHERVARDLGKPTVLEEYGVKVKRDEQGVVIGGLDTRLPLYARWNDLLLKGGANASMFWMLAGIETQGGVYKDYDHYNVYRGDETANLLSAYAKRFSASAPACVDGVHNPNDKSPFVHVPRPPQAVAFGWGPSEG
jgi:mannan endo-1,4-beta-mannosidase